jgi:hypothetical protein
MGDRFERALGAGATVRLSRVASDADCRLRYDVHSLAGLSTLEPFYQMPRLLAGA